MTTIHLKATDETAKQLAAASFPDYKGRSFKVIVVPSDYEFSLVSMWEGGSRSYYAVVDLATMKSVDISNLVGNFNRATQSLHLVEGLALVERSWFLGKETGLTFFILDANSAKLLPAVIDLTRDEKIVLAATRSLKSSYGGYSNYRQQESGLSAATWTATVDVLKAKGLLAKNGALTTDGRNAIGSMSLSAAQSL
jgi:hypothetical protein